MEKTGYIFIRNGTPNPDSNEHFISGGKMIDASNLTETPDEAAIYKKWEDYLNEMGIKS